MPTYDYPGVYIEEQPAASPIQGVGTSTAAFIGVTRAGKPNEPAFVTSFDEFRQNYDDQPMDGFYLWYAVRAFFDNGGRRAYIVKASSGRAASRSEEPYRTAAPWAHRPPWWSLPRLSARLRRTSRSR